MVTISNFYPGASSGVLSDDGRVFMIAGAHESPKGFVRDVTAFDSLTGRAMWSSPLSKLGPGLVIDSLGSRAAFRITASGEAVLVDLSARAAQQHLPHTPVAFGPGGKIWAACTEEEDRGLTLFSSGRQDPLVILAMDYSVCAQFATFDRGGRFVACVTVDGLLMVFDLPEINRRLAAIGLDWKEKAMK
jgi:hypothetical protein